MFAHFVALFGCLVFGQMCLLHLVLEKASLLPLIIDKVCLLHLVLDTLCLLLGSQWRFPFHGFMEGLTGTLHIGFGASQRASLVIIDRQFTFLLLEIALKHVVYQIFFMDLKS